jgi:hypothetical protein
MSEITEIINELRLVKETVAQMNGTLTVTNTKLNSYIDVKNQMNSSVMFMTR